MLADALNNLGVALAERKSYDEARFAHEEALSIRTRIGEQEGTAASLGNLSQVALAEGSLADARAYLERSATLGERRGDPWLQAMSLVGAARLASRQGDSRAATDLVEEALELARKHGYTSIEFGVRELLEAGDLLVEPKDVGLALD